MASLKQIKSQIRAIDKTAQITKAMYTISATKIRRAEDAFVNFRNYEKEFYKIFEVIKYDLIDYFKTREKEEIDKTIYVLIGADRGLAGSFHNNLFAFFEKLTKNDKDNSFVFAIGRKAFYFARSRKYNLLNSEIIFNRDDTQTINLEIIANTFEEIYKANNFKKISVVFQDSISQFNYEPKEEVIFPIVDDRTEDDLLYPKDKEEYILEASPNTMYPRLLYKYLETKIYKALLSSNKCEHAARVMAMKGATDNANEVKEKLSIKFNKIRQQQITNELIDIISGAKGSES